MKFKVLKNIENSLFKVSTILKDIIEVLIVLSVSKIVNYIFKVNMKR